MNTDLKTTLSGKTASFVLAGLLAIALGAIPASSFADDGAPPFTFKDRCVPYQLTDEQMLLNGIDPDRILGGADSGGGGGPGGNNIQDLDEFGNPVPCDEFHQEWRRGTYEACHFYDGSPCYFTVNGQLDQDSFTDDAAGRRAFEIADHFVIYEMVQNGPPELAANPSVPIQSIATNPFFGGFAVGTQTKIMNAGPEYWQVNPTGVWKIGFVRFTQKAFDAIANPGTYPDEYAFLVDMATTNGVNSQGAVNGGLPLIVKGDEILTSSNAALRRCGIVSAPTVSPANRRVLAICCVRCIKIRP